MAVENTTLESPLYDCDGVTTEFNAVFDFISTADVQVVLLDITTDIETIVDPTDYSVTKVGNTGYITTNTPYANTYKIKIVPNISPIQPSVFPQGDRFPANRVENGLDRVTLISQRVLAELGRSVRLPITSTLSDLVLPDGGAPRAGYVWRWSIPNGDVIEAVDPTDAYLGVDLSADIRAFLGAANNAAARTSLGLGTLATQSGTFSGTSSGNNTGDQNLFGTISVSGQSDIVADSSNDTLTLEAGANVTITTNAATDTITISSTGGGGGGLSNVVDDLTPQLGGDLDLNGNKITSPDGTDQIDIPNGTIDLKTNSSSRADITDSGFRLGGANARVTTILDEDTMSSNSDTALATQQSIKAYVDSHVGSGKVLQVVSATKTDTFSTTSTSFTNVTGLTANITPSNTNNKILVLATISIGGTSGTVPTATLARSGTPILLGDTASSRTRVGSAIGTTADTGVYNLAMNFVDSPATTSSTTYSVQLRASGSTAYINRANDDVDSSARFRGASTLILMEIGA